MKSIIFGISIIAGFILISCDKEENKLVNDSEHLVDKIYDYNNQLVGDYIYDDNNRLVEINMYFYDTDDGRRIDYEFEYHKNKVKTIKYIEYQFPQANHTIELTYNSSDQIVKKETYKNGNLIGRQYYKYYEDGKLKCLTDENENDNYFFTYDQINNAIQVKWLYVDVWFGGDTIEKYRNFLYDNMPKPNFGIDYLFFLEPLPGFGTEATLEKGISINNMIEYVESGTKWIYTYNDNDLPKTIETQWKDIKTLEPMMLRIEYKE
jgi:hypothetical protein